jgi:hypothetical protein
MKIQNSQWVFGQNTDLLVFGTPIILSVLTSSILSLSFMQFISLYILVDQSHVYTTFFYTYNSKRFVKEHKKLLFLTPLISFIVSLLVIKLINFHAVAILLAVYTVFHFSKQQAAWFFISSAKERLVKGSFEKVIDKTTIWLSVLGPALMSMNPNVGKSGWRDSNDLPHLPDFIIPIIFYSWILSTVIYLIIQIKKYQKYNYISWGKHFHLLNGLLIWVMYRLEPIHSIAFLGALLIMYSHSISYIYLGQRYMCSRVAKGEKYFLPLPPIKYLFIMLFLFGVMGAYFEVLVIAEYWLLNSVLVKSLVLTFVFTHYFFDGFLWKRQYHPEGLEFLSND